MNRKIFVALSGGVDSAVSAALLIRQGFEVEGVYLKYASEATRGFIDTTDCSWQDDLKMVEAVGRHLQIPVRSINVERQYDDRVITDFVSGYADGRTPNPDILCNRYIKFGYFFDWAISRGADRIATGHYARVDQKNGRRALRAGLDPEKDQSYFLYSLTSDILSRVEFPVGGMLKSEVRRLAKSFKLPNADRSDSQGVCFIGQLKVRDFLKSRIQGTPGPIYDTSGRRLGQHAGLAPFTIGQRHGFGLGGGQPYFVVEKNIATNSLIVGDHQDPRLFSTGLFTEPAQFNLETDQVFRCQTRIRYRQTAESATIQVNPGKRLTVTFDHPQRAVAPGQAIVLYQDDIVIGGATILTPIYEPERLAASI